MPPHTSWPLRGTASKCFIHCIPSHTESSPNLQGQLKFIRHSDIRVYIKKDLVFLCFFQMHRAFQHPSILLSMFHRAPMVGCLKTSGVSCTAWPLLNVKNSITNGLGRLVKPQFFVPSQFIEVLFGSWVCAQILWLFDILSNTIQYHLIISIMIQYLGENLRDEIHSVFIARSSCFLQLW